MYPESESSIFIFRSSDSVVADAFCLTTRDGVSLHGVHWRPRETATETGSRPLIALHGGGANARWWDHLAPRLAAKRSVYALDFRGHGDSEFPAEREIGAFGLDLDALVEWLGREDVDLVGHSLGAAVALDHASRWQSTHSLILVDLARGSGRASGRRARLALSLRRTYRSREEAIERFRFLPESSHATESLRESIARQSVKRDPDGRYGYKFDPAWFGLPSRPRPDPAEIECPTLLIRGIESGLLTPEAAQEFVTQLPAGRLVEIENAGHHVFLDNPEAFLTAVDEFHDHLLDPPARPPLDPPLST